ncbi:DUF5791 family protein [Halobacteria archaeon AArc-curdl1]|uniref:DUF5791 family protein n=1 Tax=Natronosalvus hydrolyticus TaxID=2979988 RepID=A0AAP3E653_9EURY|nr:DUF5791 family protein [Halobacteria archaeon AArc-curdl1]
MFYAQRMDVPETPAALREEYDTQLEDTLERTAFDAQETVSTTETTVEIGDVISRFEERSSDISLEEAAAIQSLEDGEPDPDTIIEIACEHLLLGMTTAVLDVDTLASELEIDLDAKEVQQKIERRAPMTFDEYVHIQHAIVSRSR